MAETDVVCATLTREAFLHFIVPLEALGTLPAWRGERGTAGRGRCARGLHFCVRMPCQAASATQTPGRGQCRCSRWRTWRPLAAASRSATSRRKREGEADVHDPSAAAGSPSQRSSHSTPPQCPWRGRLWSSVPCQLRQAREGLCPQSHSQGPHYRNGPGGVSVEREEGASGGARGWRHVGTQAHCAADSLACPSSSPPHPSLASRVGHAGAGQPLLRPFVRHLL